jgi:hypothetical protein
MNKLTKYCLGIFGIGIVLFIVLTPAINLWGTRPERHRYACCNRLSALYAATIEYASKHDGKLPVAGEWCDVIRDYLPNEKNGIDNEFLCLSDRSRGERVSSYAMNALVSDCAIAQLSKDTVLIFESQSGWNKSGGADDLFFGNHNSILESARCGVLLADGRVDHVQKTQSDTLRWEP